METRGTGAAPADVVAGSSVKTHAGVPAAITIVTRLAGFNKDKAVR